VFKIHKFNTVGILFKQKIKRKISSTSNKKHKSLISETGKGSTMAILKKNQIHKNKQIRDHKEISDRRVPKEYLKLSS
jgi:hypothetical protein